jgi:hypothetical protein
MAKAKGNAGRENAKIRIQWYRSTIATPKSHKELVRSLGLTQAQSDCRTSRQCVDARDGQKSPASLENRRLNQEDLRRKVSSRSKTMALGIHNIGAPEGANKNKKRVGRGPGSGTR